VPIQAESEGQGRGQSAILDREARFQEGLKARFAPFQTVRLPAHSLRFSRAAASLSRSQGVTQNPVSRTVVLRDDLIAMGLDLRGKIIGIEVFRATEFGIEKPIAAAKSGENFKLSIAGMLSRIAD
jgi:uncharacterized protein YuzE